MGSDVAAVVERLEDHAKMYAGVSRERVLEAASALQAQTVKIKRLEAKLREAVEVMRRVLEWAEAVAGDTRFVAEAAEEVASVEAARAFLATMGKS